MSRYTHTAFGGRWTEQGIDVARERYYFGEEKDPVTFTARVARGAAKDDYERQAYHGLLLGQYFFPNSPTLMNLGTGNGLNNSGCFVLDVPDDTLGIMQSLTDQVMIHRSGGGTGMSFGKLRPRGTKVGVTNGVASGPVSFMKLFDAATATIKQGGKRRGANMGSLPIHHPDIMEFIHCKLDGSVTNFNISCLVTEEFIDAVKDNLFYTVVDPRTSDPWNESADKMRERFPGITIQHSDRIMPSGKPGWRVSAVEVFASICEAAWSNGDPGLLFIDRANASYANPCPEIMYLPSTNPCGEEWLEPNGECNLGSINLKKYVRQEGRWPFSVINWSLLKQHTKLAVRFLDSVIDVNPAPTAAIEENVKKLRRIGLGIMGWHDVLLLLGIPYASDQGIALAHEVMSFIYAAAVESSEELAEKYGVFPLWSSSRLCAEGKKPRRNSNLMTVAPTGTLSFFADCNGGCEPFFSYDYGHTDGNGTTRRILSSTLTDIASNLGIQTDSMNVDEVISAIAAMGIPDISYLFLTAKQISPEWHIKMQAAFQSEIDNSVSKTINMPITAKINDVANAYMMAHDMGCLGITVFRDGSKGGVQVYNDNTISKDVAVDQFENINLTVTDTERIIVVPKPKRVKGETIQIATPVGNINVTINSYSEDGDPNAVGELFLVTGKSGTDITADAEAIGRLSSLIMRLKTDATQNEKLDLIESQMHGIQGSGSVGFGPDKAKSMADGLALAIKKYKAYNSNNSAPLAVPVVLGNVCPECKHLSLIVTEGCVKCLDCGYSEC